MNFVFDSEYISLSFLENGSNYVININTLEVFRITKKGLRLIKPYLSKIGYLLINLWDNYICKHYYLHRIVYMIHYGDIPKGFVIDHIDRNKMNNNITNLRLVTQSINMQNINSHGLCKNFEYRKEIGDHYEVDENVFYSKTYRKFYRKLGEEYRSLNISKHKKSNCYVIQWVNDKKHHSLTITDYVINNLIDL